jgi:hypothetical protein
MFFGDSCAGEFALLLNISTCATLEQKFAVSRPHISLTSKMPSRNASFSFQRTFDPSHWFRNDRLRSRRSAVGTRSPCRAIKNPASSAGHFRPLPFFVRGGRNSSKLDSLYPVFVSNLTSSIQRGDCRSISRLLHTIEALPTSKEYTSLPHSVKSSSENSMRPICGFHAGCGFRRDTAHFLGSLPE